MDPVVVEEPHGHVENLYDGDFGDESKRYGSIFSSVHPVLNSLSE